MQATTISSALLPQLAAAARAAAASTPATSAGQVRRRSEATADAQFRAEMAHVQQYICAQVGDLDEDAAHLLGVHDSRSRSYYDEIQLFLEHKQQLEQQRHEQDRVLIRSLDEYLNELDPSLFAEGATPATPRHTMGVTDLPPSSSYIRRKQEEAMLARLWHKYQSVEAERCSSKTGASALGCGGASFKRQRVM